MKKTIVWGTSLKSHRYSNMAVKSLLYRDIETLAFGLNEGSIDTVQVQTDPEYFRTIPDIHSISLYVSPPYQKEYVPIWLELKPERILFNPGTENPGLYASLQKVGIQVEEACTLVLLSTGQY